MSGMIVETLGNTAESLRKLASALRGLNDDSEKTADLGLEKKATVILDPGHVANFLKFTGRFQNEK